MATDVRSKFKSLADDADVLLKTLVK